MEVRPAHSSLLVPGVLLVLFMSFLGSYSSAATISGTVSPVSSSAGVTITLTGAANATTTVNSSGTYSFTGLASGTYTVTPSQSGASFSPPSQSVTLSRRQTSAVANFTMTSQSGGSTASLIVDAQTWADSSNASTTVSTPAFATSAGSELLLAFVATDGPSGGTIQVNSVSGGGLTWSLVKRSNAQHGTAEIWRAFATNSLASAVVTAALSSSAASSVTVLSFKGVDTTGTNGSGAVGATASSNASSGAPTVSLVSTRNSSWILGVGNDWNSAVARTVGSNQSIIHQYLASVGDTYWVQGQNAPTPLAGSTVTINDTAPTSDSYNLTAIEVLPANTTGGSGGGTTTYSISGTIAPTSGGAQTTVSLTGAASAAVTADSSGNYSFGGLANGSYTVTPSKSGYTFTPASLSETVSGSNLSGQNFTATAVVPQTYSISGTLSPASAAAGSLVTLSGSANATTTANASGNYSFAGLQNGSYTVTPSSSSATFTPSSLAVSVNATSIAGANFTATSNPPTTYSISGTVSPAPAGSGTTLTLSGSASASSTADASGNYTFNNLVNGSYTVTPSKSGFTFTPPSSSVNVGSASVTGVNFSAQSSASAALIVDAQTWGDSSTASSTISTPAFTTSAGNELVLALIATDGSSGSAIQVNSISGAGLTWSLVKRTNTQPGTAEIWRAFAASPLTNSVVTATLSSAAASSITIISFKGVDTTGTNGSGAVGATASGNATSGAPTASVVTTRNNSWVLGVGNDWDKAVSRVVGPNQSMIHQYLASVGDTYWVQGQNAPTPLSGTTVTINDTSPTTDHYNLAAVEVLPSTTSGSGSGGGGVSTYTISGTITPASNGVGATVALTGSASAVVTADSTGNYSFTGLASGSYTITPSKSGYTFTPASLQTTVSGASVSLIKFTATSSSGQSACGDTLTSGSPECQIIGSGQLNSAWTVISRHGEYAQNETECNVPGAITTSPLTIATSYSSYICGDFNEDSTVADAPTSWPYTTGAIQWSSTTFEYGTVTIRTKIPPINSATWPAYWFLDARCQGQNPFNASASACSTGYTEVDMIECMTNSSGYTGKWCTTNIYNGSTSPAGTCSWNQSPIDTNFHTYVMTWAPGSLNVTVDGGSTGCSFSGSGVPSKPLFMIIQTQTASGASGIGPPNNSYLPSTLVTDFVSVVNSSGALIFQDNFASDIYFGQSAAGTGSGDDCADARATSSMLAMDWIHGHTLHFCGALTSTITALGSGTVSNPITLKFEPGAYFIGSAWSTAVNLNGFANISVPTVPCGGSGCPSN